MTPRFDISKKDPRFPGSAEKKEEDEQVRQGKKSGPESGGNTREPSIIIRFAYNYIHIC